MRTVRQHVKQSRERRELVKHYLRLQQELVEGDPSQSSYQGTIQAFRQMGYLLISSGMEADLDRLLRLRVIEGGKGRDAREDQELHRPLLQVVR